jgi:hypothetical protein
VLDEIRSKGAHRAREINRAHVLSSLETALACSAAPEGRSRWTTGELKRVARQEEATMAPATLRSQRGPQGHPE